MHITSAARKAARKRLLLGTALAALATAAQGQDATRPFDVPAQPATTGIPEFAREAGIQIVASADAVRGKLTNAVRGNLPVHAALAQLLAGTGIGTASDDGQIIVLAAQPKNAAAAFVEGAARPESNAVETVTVTAEKKAESSLDVPMGLTALSGEQLTRTQSFRFEDYVGKVPGLDLVSSAADGNELVIRGISGTVNSGVATYIDETPYVGVGVYATSSLIAPNLDTFDMQRIEVLKGPQGTLYGASALGGLLKYVTNAPDPSGFAATVQAGVSTVYNGGAGFDLHGMVNVPLADDLALRLVGYDNYYPGFIDDPSRGLKDINGSRYEGGRASLLYEPTADFSVRLSALYQKHSWDDNNNEDVEPGTLKPVYGSLIQERVISQPGQTTNQLYNLTANWNVGFARIVSSSSYGAYNNSTMIDDSLIYGATLNALLHEPYGAALPESFAVRFFTQEVRLASADDQPLQWQIGGFFNSEDGSFAEGIYPVVRSTGTILYDFPTVPGILSLPTTYREYAGFANLDYHVTPTFDVSAGGRYSTNSQTFHETATGLFFGKGENFGQVSSEGVFTYSGDARWHITPDNMLYARIASGFVPGGPNDVTPSDPVPGSYRSSTTINYEAGIKSSFFDDRLTAELTVYDIDWQHIQINAIVGGYGVITNGGAAQSDGVEWNFAYVPLSGLTLDFNGAYDDARLTEPTPASAGGHAGNPLPGTPLWESSASADYERPLFGDYSGFAGVDWRFTGSRYAAFQTTPRQEMPNFAIVDLRAGVETEKWSFELYVKNVGNTIAIDNLIAETTAGGNGVQSASLYTPRTIGVTLTARF